MTNEELQRSQMVVKKVKRNRLLLILASVSLATALIFFTDTRFALPQTEVRFGFIPWYLTVALIAAGFLSMRPLLKLCYRPYFDLYNKECDPEAWFAAYEALTSKKSREKNPLTYHYNRAISALHSGDFQTVKENAAPFFQNAEYATGAFLLCKVAYYEGNEEEFRLNYDRFLEEGKRPDVMIRPWEREQLELLHAQLSGDTEEALERASRPSEPDSPPIGRTIIAFNRGLVCRACGRPDLARPHLMTVVQYGGKTWYKRTCERILREEYAPTGGKEDQ
ncbi:MAG: hypothetical protein IJU52_05395 [Clostridia bacterium]|nr:hypothetical protein [Clostridia bacterium]